MAKASPIHSSRIPLSLLLAPVIVLLIAGVLIPMGAFLFHGFVDVWGPGIDLEFSLRHFERLFDRPIYLRLLFKAVMYGAIVSVISFCLVFPAAYFVSASETINKNVVLLIVLIPLYTSDIVRIFAWRSILGANGFINQVLMGLGVIETPIVELLYSPYAAILSLVHMMFPFMFLAVWAGLETLKKHLVEAAYDLGASQLRVIRKVILPLIVPGIFAGFVFVFVPVSGDYLYINLMGGPSGVTITKVIVQQFGAANNWAFGAALTASMMVTSFVVLLLVFAAASRLPSMKTLQS